MPELPETETIARDLNRAISGSTIESIRVTRPTF
jgi:formamidopyrimidine-DNA glycosylase